MSISDDSVATRALATRTGTSPEFTAGCSSGNSCSFDTSWCDIGYSPAVAGLMIQGRFDLGI